VIRHQLIVVNRLGLHARAAAKFVSLASRFEADVHLAVDGTRVNGKSIMGIMMLAAGKGTELELEVEGADEGAAASALAELVETRFGEDD